MRKRLILSCLSIVLCFCVIFNSNNYRSDVYAFAPVAVVGWVAVSLVASAAGIYFANTHDTAEYQQWCKDCAAWIQEQAVDGYDTLNDILSGDIFLDVAGRYLFTEDAFTTIAGWIADWCASDDCISKYGDLLADDFVAEVISDTAYPGTFCNDLFTNTVNTYIAYGDPYVMSGIHNYIRDDVDYRGFDRFDVYFLDGYDLSEFEKHYSGYNIVYSCILALVYSSSTTGNFVATTRQAVVGEWEGETDKFYTWVTSVVPNNIYPKSSVYTDNLEDIFSTIYTCNNYGPKYTYSDLLQVAHFALTADSVDVPSSSADLPVEIADDSIFTNDQYITNVINNYSTIVEGIEGTEGTDISYIPVNYPAYSDSGNVITSYLPGLTATDVLDGTAGVTGVLDVLENPPSISDVDSVSFFDKLVDILSDFFSFAGLFDVPDGYWDDWFNIFTDKWISKGLIPDFDFLDREFSEIRIPDFYINWKGQQCLILDSDIIYTIAGYVKGYIKALIYFLLLLHDRKRIVYLIRGTLPPDEDPVIKNGI